MILKAIATALLFLSSALSHADAPLRVMSFNLRYINSGDTGERAWTNRRDQVADVIRNDRPDIIGIQEGFRQMLDDIETRVPGYVEIGGGREDGLAKGEYSAILLKADRFTILSSGTFALSDTPEIIGSSTWGNKVVRICTWAKIYDRSNQRAFHFFNTHLDHQVPDARLKGIQLILSRMAACGEDGAFILTGDLNAGTGDQVHQLITGSPCTLIDTWQALHADAKPEESGTVHSFSGKIDGPRIDYIYASKAFTATESSIIRSNVSGVFPSDHYPIRATLSFSDHQPASGE